MSEGKEPGRGQEQRYPRQTFRVYYDSEEDQATSGSPEDQDNEVTPKERRQSFQDSAIPTRDVSELSTANESGDDDIDEMSFEIQEFRGSEGEDVELFIDLVTYSFIKIEKTFTDADAAKKAKTALLISNTGGDARIFVRDLPKETRNNWDQLVKELTQRFPVEENVNVQSEVMDALFNLKQNGRKDREYFEEVRRLARLLPKQIETDVGRKMLQGLDNRTVAQVVGALMSNKKYTVEEVIKSIEGATGYHGPTVAETEESRQKGEIPALDPHQRAMVEAITGQTEMMKLLMAQLNQTRQSPQPSTSTYPTSGRPQGGQGGSGYGQEPDSASWRPQPAQSQPYSPMPPMPARITAAAHVEDQWQPDVKLGTGREVIDDWEEADENSFQYAHTNQAEAWTRFDAEEVYAAGNKRTVDEAGLDSDTALDIRNQASPQKKHKNTGKTPRAKAPPRKPRGMAEQSSWDAASFLRDTIVSLSMMQLVDIEPKARAALAESLRLEPAPNSKTALRKRNIAVRESVASAEAYTRSPSERPQSRQPLNDLRQQPLERMQSEKTVRHAQSVSAMSAVAKGNKVAFDDEVEEVPVQKELSLRKLKDNFYTQGVCQPNKNDPKEFDLKMILVDGGSSLNLIPERMLKRLALTLVVDDSIIIKTADGRFNPLPGYTMIKLIIAGVPGIVQASIVPGNTSYNLLLGRPWLRKNKAIGFYEFDEYWIRDQMGIDHELPAVRSPQVIETPVVKLSAKTQQHKSALPFDCQTIEDLEVSQNVDTDKLLELIIRQADDADDEEESDDESDSDTELQYSGKASRS
ncbi:MAG: hypothetical protein Q9182_004518 [Xanthomendoza sp. 2 TL-2023]